MLPVVAKTAENYRDGLYGTFKIMYRQYNIHTIVHIKINSQKSYDMRKVVTFLVVTLKIVI